MSWETVKLADLCTVITKGTTPSNIGATFTDIGVNYIRSEMITDAKYIASTGMLYIDKETHEKLKRSQLKKGDILFSMAGVYLGKTAILREEDVPANTNQAVALIRIDSSKCNLEYVYYFLNLPETVIKVNTVSGQAAQPNINLKQIGNIEILLPSLDKQNKIVNILSAYDELIENNQKQIKLLEEAAQRLYKEWFVDLRFPGYETTPIIDGIPQGWTQESIDNVYSIKYGKNLPTTEISTNGKYPVYGANGVIGYYDKYNCDSYVTLITSRGNGSGDVSRTHHLNVFVTNNSFVVIPQQTYDFITNEFTYWLMKYTDFKSVCTGSAQPQLTNNSVSTLKVVIPTPKLVIEYSNTVHIMFKKIENLLQQNQLLAETRDRLLPKLMSGELEV